MSWVNRSALGVLVVAGAACGLPLDVLGENEDVTQHDGNSITTDPIADDNIADKHPVYDPSRRVTETFSGATFTWNKSAAVTELDIQDFRPGDDALKDRIFPSYGAARAAIPNYTLLPSMELVNAMLKPFDDGLYAAIELAAETGDGKITMNKRATFDALVQQLLTRASSGSAAEQGFAREAAAQLATAETSAARIHLPRAARWPRNFRPIRSTRGRSDFTPGRRRSRRSSSKIDFCNRRRAWRRAWARTSKRRSRSTPFRKRVTHFRAS